MRDAKEKSIERIFKMRGRVTFEEIVTPGGTGMDLKLVNYRITIEGMSTHIAIYEKVVFSELDEGEVWEKVWKFLKLNTKEYGVK